MTETKNASGTLRRPRVAVPLLCAAAILLLAIVIPLVQGGEYYDGLHRNRPDLFTSLATSLLRAAALLGAVAALSQILLAMVLLWKRGAAAGSEEARDLRVVSRRAAGLVALWGVCSLLLIFFIGADNNGVSLNRVFNARVIDFIESTQSSQVWIISAVIAVVVVPLLWFRPGPASWTMGAVGVLGGFLAVVFTGQVSVGVDHDFASDAAGFGFPPLLIWIALLLAVYWHLASGRRLSLQAFRRAHLGALAAVLVALLTYLVVGWQGLAGTAPWESEYGVVLTVLLLSMLAGAALLFVLRWRFNQAMDTDGGSPRGYAALLTTGLMLGCIALASYFSLGRVVPPRYAQSQTSQENYLGFSIDGSRTLVEWLLPARQNMLFLILALLGIGLYLLGIWVLHRRSDRWPVGRTISWVLGWVCVYYMTSSQWGIRSPGSFSLHMLSHMGLNMLAPVLLVLGGPVTLALRALHPARAGSLNGPREWINAMMHSRLTALLTQPLLVFAIFVGSYYLLYFSPLFEFGMRYHWTHQLMNLHFMISGYLFYWLVIGVDRAPRPLPYIGKLGFALAAMPFHAFFAVALMSSTTIIADNLYRTLAPDWNTDFTADQYLGGGIAWAAGELPLIVVVVALLTQWSRSDERESRRQDRQGDRSGEANLDSYNEMLATLSKRSSGQPPAQGDTNLQAVPGQDQESPEAQESQAVPAAQEVQERGSR
ncbi:cytochrome c oxidase assembly protein [Acaricomes phytoseiuli]|uniref:cytochrome c oxidase assembly protein n=1 Tax=Acaricomes phytoseiuli TaxID=291968 RepID=UPI0022229D26|nr:cytochrome c oxidase assembly protein [Acaricomes phytoseiuli]MCW1248609.1 cytochrome c oxidase assembly protein [Acaricomes phytoseiuli]